MDARRAVPAGDDRRARLRGPGPAGRPPRPAIFAFKHQSAWETLAIHLLLDGAAIALKRELTQIPLFGWTLLHAGMIRVDRHGGPRALRGLIEGGRALERGSPIVIFPEGTRVPPGEHRAYQPGVAALYRHLDCPVVPVALNSGVFWPRRSFVKRPGRIVVEFCRRSSPGWSARRSWRNCATGWSRQPIVWSRSAPPDRRG